MTDTQRILVTGATGNQGGAVVDHLLAAEQSFDVRGLTRDASSDAAASLEDRGVTMVEGDLDGWPEGVRDSQRNWIGRQEGAEISFDITGHDAVDVFTTRPDTVFGATFLAISPGHELADALASDDGDVATYVDSETLPEGGSQDERAGAKRHASSVGTGPIRRTAPPTPPASDRRRRRPPSDWRGTARLRRRLRPRRRGDGCGHGRAGPQRARPRLRDGTGTPGRAGG